MHSTVKQTDGGHEDMLIMIILAVAFAGGCFAVMLQLCMHMRCKDSGRRHYSKTDADADAEGMADKSWQIATAD